MTKLNSFPEWVQDAIFYQIFPDRFANGDISNDPISKTDWNSKPTLDNYFGGDLLGIIQKLDYLQDLGINAIYLNPIFQAQSNHKYDAFDYFKIDPSFGNKETFKTLVDECHRRNMRVILDGVFNHCGFNSIFFDDIKKNGKQSKYFNWFEINSLPLDENEINYQTCGGTWYLPKFNTHISEVRDYLFDVAVYWIEDFGIDGWRLDVPWKIPFSFWTDFRKKIKSRYPEIYLVGEIWRNPSLWSKGNTFDGIMNYPLRSAIMDYCIYDHMDAEDFSFELKIQSEIFNDSIDMQLNLLGSHDTPRILTLCQGNINRELLAYTFLLTYIGAPMIYYGDEIGLIGGNDPDCRKTMSWNHPDGWNIIIKEHIENLIQARKDHPALRKGAFTSLLTFNGIFAYQRLYEDDCAIIVINPRKEYQDIKIPYEEERLLENEKWQDLLTGNIYNSEKGFLSINHINAMTSLVLFKMR